jgi:hypothetical protein
MDTNYYDVKKVLTLMDITLRGFFSSTGSMIYFILIFF